MLIVVKQKPARRPSMIQEGDEVNTLLFYCKTFLKGEHLFEDGLPWKKEKANRISVTLALYE